MQAAYSYLYVPRFSHFKLFDWMDAESTNKEKQ